MAQTPTSGEFTRKDLRPGTILTAPNNIRCRVDRMEGDNVHLSVLDTKKIDGLTELVMPLDTLQRDKWLLTKRAA